MKNKLDIIDWFLIIALGFYLMIGTIQVYGQENVVVAQGFTITKVDGGVTIDFEDKSKDKLYQYNEDGILELFYIPKGKLELSDKEYTKFKKDAVKTAKWMDYELERDKYTFNAYPYAEESIFFINEEGQIGEILLNDLKKL